jgi:hypothetical protein
MIKFICLGLLSFGLAANSYALPWDTMFNHPLPKKSVQALKNFQEVALQDFSGYWQGNIDGDDIELNISQTENSIEINGELYELNALNNKSRANPYFTTTEVAIAEKQEDGSLKVISMDIEKSYFDRGMHTQKLIANLYRQDEKLIIRFEPEGAAPVVIEFVKRNS